MSQRCHDVYAFYLTIHSLIYLLGKYLTAYLNHRPGTIVHSKIKKKKKNVPPLNEPYNLVKQQRANNHNACGWHHNEGVHMTQETLR